MDQVKTGRFIAEKRKQKGLTQMQLAEKLGITDRAVSKWETGRSLPDASIMIELCGILDMSVNDLLCGEQTNMGNYNEEMERHLIEIIGEKERADKRLLSFEILMGIMTIGFFIVATSVSAYLLSSTDIYPWIGITLMATGIVQLIVTSFFMLKIEQVAGYYECAECGHRYVPKYSAVNLSPHAGRTRYMKCPHCGKRSWQKKVLNK